MRVVAPTLHELFEEAGRGLAELMLERAAAAAPAHEERIGVRAPDRAALLVDWLNELIFLSETRALVFTEFQVDEISEGALSARARGVTPEAIRTAVKAATLYDVSVLDTPEGYTASVVLDV